VLAESTALQMHDQTNQKTAVDEAWIGHLKRLHWQVYMQAGFATPVGEDYARSAAIRFAESLGPPAYAAVFWGPGAVGGRYHVHLLLGGVLHGRPRTTGLNLSALGLKRLERAWRHGQVQKVELFDPKYGVEYVVDHHQVEIVGSPRRHRPRRQRGKDNERVTNHECTRAR
jgi:hypothetical protein